MLATLRLLAQSGATTPSTLTVVPDTGVTREYWLTLDDVTVAPDGVSRSAMAVNG